jgi:hypothetical protein
MDPALSLKRVRNRITSGSQQVSTWLEVFAGGGLRTD